MVIFRRDWSVASVLNLGNLSITLVHLGEQLVHVTGSKLRYLQCYKLVDDRIALHLTTVSRVQLGGNSLTHEKLPQSSFWIVFGKNNKTLPSPHHLLEVLH